MMQRRFLVLVTALVALGARAGAARVPCSPILIADPQGRPIPNAIFTVHTTAGVQVTNVYASATGTTLLTVIPPNQILQFWLDDPGVYQVDLSGLGLAKAFYTICGEGFGGTDKLISIDRNAENMLLYPQTNPALQPQLTCNDGKACKIDFLQQTVSCVQIDWINPSFPLTFSTFTASYLPAFTTAAARWFTKDCAYKVGEAPCDVWGAGTTTTATTTNPVVAVRTDLNVALVPTWTALDHVLLLLCYDGTGEQWPAPSLENIRVEFSR